jgi:hypothetical protein
MMDNKFRRKKPEDRADIVLEWYANNETTGVRGNIADYQFNSVWNNMLLAYNLFVGEVLQYSQQ